MRYALLLLLAIAVLAGCRDSAEFFYWSGAPEGHDGWKEDYEASPSDVWEAIRLVARDNGTIAEENPEEFELKGEYKPHDSSEWDGISFRAKVYDKSKDKELRSRLIVHAWYAGNANDRERQDTAREYCNAVFRVIKAWKGEPENEDPTVTTTSEEPVRDDEAIGFFKLTREQVYAATRTVIGKYGKIEQADDKTFFIRGTKENALEKQKDDVRVNIYDRTEEGAVRTKISVRVLGEGNEPLQEIARSYMAEIRKELEKAHGPQE